MKVLTMDTERFAVPELLFQPSDIGINQAGIVEATWQSLQKLPMVSNKQYLAHMHLENICLHTDSHTDMHTNINIFFICRTFLYHIRFIFHTVHECDCTHVISCAHTHKYVK